MRIASAAGALLWVLICAPQAQGQALTITSGPILPSGVVGQQYSVQLTATGGNGEYSWFIAADSSLPAGLTLDPTGLLHGTIPSPPLGTNALPPFTVTVLSNDNTASKSLTIPVGAPTPPVSINAASPPPAEVNQPYSFTFTATQAGVTWSLQGAPAWLSINPGTGVLSGTPTAPGAISFTVVASIAGGSATLPVAITVYPALVISAGALPPGTVGVPYSQQIAISGGTGQGYWITAAGLPPGLAMSLTGVVSGTPTSAGPFPGSITARDSAGYSTTDNFSITILPALRITTTSLPAGTVGAAYTATLNASGGSGTYIWSATTSLPAGLNLSSGGQLSGTPTAAGSFPIGIIVADSADNSATTTFTIQVGEPALVITTTSLPNGTVGTPYSSVLSVAAPGITNPPAATWSIVDGALPTGLTLSSGGTISGTPTTAGSSTFTVQASAAAFGPATATFTIQVTTPALTITTATLPNGTIGIAYSAQLSASVSSGGAQPALTWTVVSGALPPGLALSADGAISGTPTTAGAFAFTVQAAASTLTPATAPFTVTISQPAPSTISVTLPSTLMPGSQPSIGITISPAYPLPITMTAALAIAPDVNSQTDLAFQTGMGMRTTQFTIPANTTDFSLPFQVGTSAGTVTVTLNATGQPITPSGPLTATGQIPAQAPFIRSVTATASTASTLTVTVIGFSDTRDMKTAQFHFTPAAGATLAATDFTVDVTSVFSTWFANAASYPTGSQFKLTMPFTLTGSATAISSVTVTLTNSNSASAPATAPVQ